MPGRGVAVAVTGLALLLSACVTGYSREAPMGVFPSGELSGPPTRFVGWKFSFATTPASPPGLSSGRPSP